MDKSRPTIDEAWIQQEADHLLSIAKRDLESDGKVVPHALIVGDAESAFIAIDPALMATPADKDRLAAMMRAQAKKMNARVVFFLSDMWTGEQTVHQHNVTQLARASTGQGLGIPELAAMGLSTRREALGLIIDQPHGTRFIHQFYQRAPGNRILWEERTELNQADRRVAAGRMARFL